MNKIDVIDLSKDENKPKPIKAVEVAPMEVHCDLADDIEMKNKIDHLKNFGFSNEIQVDAPGINSKMDEIRSAYGLLNLKQVDKAIESRKATAEKYKAAL